MNKLDRENWERFCKEYKIDDYDQYLLDVSQGNLQDALVMFNLIYDFAYKDGYELGESIANKTIKSLQAKNAELKAKNDLLYKTLNHLRENKKRKDKKIKNLEEGDVARFEAWDNRLTELEQENAELKAQIEKMKCCENCKFWIDNDCTIEHDYDCKRWNNHNTDDFWECVE